MNVLPSTSAPKRVVVGVLLSTTVTVKSASDWAKLPSIPGAVAVITAVPFLIPVIIPWLLTLAIPSPDFKLYVTVPVYPFAVETNFDMSERRHLHIIPYQTILH